MLKNVMTVSDLVNQIKNLLEGQFHEVMVEGEISNLSLSSAGHWYFTLSDSGSSISAALFKMDAFRNPLIKRLKDGIKVLCVGPIGVYSKRGSFQLIVKKVLPMGEGDLMAQFETLKRKLQDEGLFRPEAKKKIPEYPKRIALITALHGAALHDFLNVFRRRSIWMDLVIIPAQVQGNEAPASLIRAVRLAQKASTSAAPIDVLVLARGGGSLEDLWAFNDEALARTIFECKIPTVSAVGHHVDFTISDFVADLRAETPSAAAEILSASQTRLKQKIHYLTGRLKGAMELAFARPQLRLNRGRPDLILQKLLRKFYHHRERLEGANPLKKVYEITRVYEKNYQLDENVRTMIFSMEKLLSTRSGTLENLHNLLKAMDPRAVLHRGYSFLRDDEGHIVGDLGTFSSVPAGAPLWVEFHDGKGMVKKV